MGFHENAKFPRVAEYTSAGGPGGAVSVTKLRSGAEERNAPWSSLMHSYQVALNFKERSQAAAIIAFYHQRNGLENGFRFEDPMDHNSTAVGYGVSEGLGGIDHDDEDVEIGVGDTSTTAFQLIKVYTDGVSPQRIRTINKPITGTVLIALDDVAKTEGADYSIDYTTGVVTFNIAPGAGVSITAGFRFDVPVRFGLEINEQFLSEVVSWDSAAVRTLTLVELLEPPYADDEWWPGGAQTFNFAVNTVLSPLNGKLVVAKSTNAGAKLILPAVSSLESNGTYFKVLAEIDSEDFDVYSEDSMAAIATQIASSSLTYAIYVNASGVRTWRAF